MDPYALRLSGVRFPPLCSTGGPTSWGLPGWLDGVFRDFWRCVLGEGKTPRDARTWSISQHFEDEGLSKFHRNNKTSSRVVFFSPFFFVKGEKTGWNRFRMEMWRLHLCKKCSISKYGNSLPFWSENLCLNVGGYSSAMEQVGKLWFFDVSLEVNHHFKEWWFLFWMLIHLTRKKSWSS